MPYKIVFAKSVKRHLEALTARERSTVLDAVEQQLLHDPLIETKNRKPLRPNPVAPWELRVGRLRVFYEADAGTTSVVYILAVGKKVRNVVWIADEAIEL